MNEKKYKFIVNKKEADKEILNREREIARELRKQKLSLREISEIIGNVYLMISLFSLYINIFHFYVMI